MEIKDIRNMNKEDLVKELASSQDELNKFRFDVKAGKEKNVRKGLRIKKNIARIRTVLNELGNENDRKDRK